MTFPFHHQYLNSKFTHFLRFVLVILICLSLGTHWVVLQGVAWTSMFLNHLNQDSVTAAIEKTFDGEHPCPLCLAIKDVQKDKKEDPDSVVNHPTNKFLAVLVTIAKLISPTLTQIQSFPNFVFLCELRSYKPTLPPPRLQETMI
jgi:hypothetical protein